MKKRVKAGLSHSVWLVVLIVGLLFQSSSLFADEAGVEMGLNGPAEIVLPAKMGDVTFPHAAHQAKVADCMSCHHQGVEAGACSSCHGVTEGVPSVKDALHKQCKSCHKKESGPTSCKSCHVKS